MKERPCRRSLLSLRCRADRRGDRRLPPATGCTSRLTKLPARLPSARSRYASPDSGDWRWLRPALLVHPHHALPSVLAREQADQRFGRILESLDHVLLDFELARLDPMLQLRDGCLPLVEIV